MGLTQSALAKKAGISASYLNLIESNRRSIAGRVLLSLATELDLKPSELSEAPEQAMLADLREAALQRGATDVSAPELIGRYPGWAATLTAVHRDNRRLQKTLADLSDRLTHDPFLAESMHEILSNITALRSTAGILSDPGGMSADQHARFLAILQEETARLTNAAQNLTDYFDRDPTDIRTSASPEESLDRFLHAHGHAFPALDRAPTDRTIESLLTQAAFDSELTRELVLAHLKRYADDARALPFDDFADKALAFEFDPGQLAAHYQSDYPQVFRRLAGLQRDGRETPAMACLQIGQSAHVIHRRPLPDIPLPRHSTACALWPVFHAFRMNGTPVRELCALPDGTQCWVLAVATPVGPPVFGSPPVMEATMLVIPDRAWPGTVFENLPRTEAIAVGPGCRLCPRTDCIARSTKAIIA